MMYINRGWRADAVAQFASALKTDLSARGAPEVLEALTELVASGRAETEASALIMRAYGTEALPALATKIAATRAPDAAARLRTLHARIDRAQGIRR
jgi:flagellar biosynthesis regulator FlbT